MNIKKPKNLKRAQAVQKKRSAQKKAEVKDTFQIRIRENEKTTTAPVAVASEQRFPLRGIGARKSHRFQNSEFISTVNGSVAFSAIRFPMNPGMPGSFPWLSVEASRWEQYRFHALRLRYITRTSTGTAGSVILSPDYNVRDPLPTSEQQANNTQDSVENVVWREICTSLDVNAMFALGPRKLIRTGNVAGDTNLYDAANFHFCTTGEADASAIGKLWVDYDVELCVPQNSPPETGSALYTSFGGMAAAQGFASTVLELLNFDALTLDPLAIGNPVAGVFTPLAGTYFITVDTTFMDSSAETFQAGIEVLKNGASVVPRVNADFLVTNPAGGYVSVSVNGIISFNGTDTLSVNGLVIGAAGTLTIPANSTYITFRPT